MSSARCIKQSLSSAIPKIRVNPPTESFKCFNFISSLLTPVKYPILIPLCLVFHIGSVAISSLFLNAAKCDIIKLIISSRPYDTDLDLLL